MAKQLSGWADQPEANVARDSTPSARASTLVDALNEILSDFGYLSIVSVEANGAWLADPSKILDELHEILQILDDVSAGVETAIGTTSAVASTFLDSSYEIRPMLDDVPVGTEKPTRAFSGGAPTDLDSPNGTLRDGAPVVMETPNDMPTTGGTPGLDARNESLRDIGNEPVVLGKSNDMPTAGEPTNVDSLDEILRDINDVPVVPEKLTPAAPEKPVHVIPAWRAASADGKAELKASALGLTACPPIESAVAIATHLVSTSPSALSTPSTIATPRPRRRYLALTTGIALAAGMSLFIPFPAPGGRILLPAVTEKFTQSINTVVVWSKNWRATPSLTAIEEKLALERGVAATASAPSKATADPSSKVELNSASLRATEADFSPYLLTPIGSSPTNAKVRDLAGDAGARKTSPLPAGPAAPEMVAPGAAVAKAPPTTSAIAADRPPGPKVVAAAVPAIASTSLPAIPEVVQVIPEGSGTSAPVVKSQSISGAAIPSLLRPESSNATVGRAASSGSDASKPAQSKITEQRDDTQSLSSVVPHIQWTTDLTASTGMREQGDAQMIKGDISTARLYYRVAAANGDADAALSLGNTYNPAFLVRLGVLGMRGDITQATEWYHRAQALGSGDAERALQTLSQ